MTDRPKRSLAGSPKQVAWAEKIREQFVAKLKGYEDKAARQTAEGQKRELVEAEIAPWLLACRRLAVWALAQTDARRLIDATQLRQNPESLGMDFTPEFDGDVDQTDEEIGTFAAQMRRELRAAVVE